MIRVYIDATLGEFNDYSYSFSFQTVTDSQRLNKKLHTGSISLVLILAQNREKPRKIRIFLKKIAPKPATSNWNQNRQF